MDPMLILSLLGLAKDLVTPQVTDLTKGQPRDLNATRSNDFYNLLMNPSGSLGAGAWNGMAKNYLRQSAGATEAMNRSASRSSGDILSELMKGLPGIQSAAGSAAEASTQRSGSSMVDLAKLASAQARQTLETRLANTGGFNVNSGGTLAALAAGTAAPLLQAQTAIDQMYGQSFNDQYSKLLSGLLSKILGQTDEYGKVASSFGQLGSQAGQQGGLLAQLLAGQSEQQLLAPQLQTRPSMFDSLTDAGMQSILYDIARGKSINDLLGFSVQPAAPQSFGPETLTGLIRPRSTSYLNILQ